MFISLFISKSKFIQKSFAPLRFADARVLASQVRAFFIRVHSPLNVKRGKLSKVKNCLRRAGKKSKARYQPARLSYLPSPQQFNISALSKSVRFTACPSAHSVFLCGYHALFLYAAHSPHTQATCERGIAHRNRAGYGHRGSGVAFRATIGQYLFVRRHRCVFHGSSTASQQNKNRKRVRARALSRFASQHAHIRAFNLNCVTP